MVLQRLNFSQQKDKCLNNVHYSVCASDAPASRRCWCNEGDTPEGHSEILAGCMSFNNDAAPCKGAIVSCDVFCLLFGGVLRLLVFGEIPAGS